MSVRFPGEVGVATARTRIEPQGVIFNVQRASFHDGPGVRTTLFLKGCPLRCPWCHNPEGVQRGVQVGFDAGRCLHCNACLDACARAVGPLPAGARLGSAGCAACEACIEACPGGARRLFGRVVTVDDLLAEVGRDRPVFETSGGGVTFSGGEPLHQADFLCACLEGCRRAGIHTAVDTCGVAARQAVVAAASRTDLLLWDVKHLNPDRHLELTGTPLAPVLANLAAAAATGVTIWLRLPILAGVNDDEEHIAAVARLAAATPGVARLSLLPYHATGTGKLARLGDHGCTGGFAAPPSERLRALAGLLNHSGVDTTVGG